jgi:glutaredoxin
MITFQKREDIAPVCPHCKKEINRILYQELKGEIGKRYIYFYPHCKATLGLLHRKGLTFGW